MTDPQNLEEAPLHTDIYEFANTSSDVVNIMIEPWAPDFDVQPGEIWRFIAVSPVPGKFEVVQGKRRIIVYGWDGSTAQVFRGDEHIFDCTPAFPLKPGRTTRSLINLLFDNEADL